MFCPMKITRSRYCNNIIKVCICSFSQKLCKSWIYLGKPIAKCLPLGLCRCTYRHHLHPWPTRFPCTAITQTTKLMNPAHSKASLFQKKNIEKYLDCKLLWILPQNSYSNSDAHLSKSLNTIPTNSCSNIK